MITTLKELSEIVNNLIELNGAETEVLNINILSNRIKNISNRHTTGIVYQDDIDEILLSIDSAITPKIEQTINNVITEYYQYDNELN